METSAESYLSNVVNGSVTMMAEVCDAAARERSRCRRGDEKRDRIQGVRGRDARQCRPPPVRRRRSGRRRRRRGSAVGEPAVDLVHLARQTDGDRGPAAGASRPVRQTVGEPAGLASDCSAERRRRADAAHQLKGSALAVGAGMVARAAAAVEAALAADADGAEAVESALAALAAAVEAARAALAGLRG